MKSFYKHLEHWFTQSPGKYLLEAESALLGNLLPRLFGYHLLQMGGTSDGLWLKDCRIPHRVHLSPTCPCDFHGSCIIGDFNHLPLIPDSVDVVLLPHLLEFVDQPKVVLQEVYNALTPEGYLVILGFHPWSLWGLARLFKHQQQVPWCGKFYSSFQVQHWLREIGYSIENHQTLFFRPPLKNAVWIKRLLFMEALGQLIWPYLGSVYLIVAKKRVLTYTPAREWRKTKVRVSQVAQPTVRMNNDRYDER